MLNPKRRHATGVPDTQATMAALTIMMKTVVGRDKRLLATLATQRQAMHEEEEEEDEEESWRS